MGAMKDVAIRKSDVTLDVEAGRTTWATRRNLGFQTVEFARCVDLEAAQRVQAWAERAYPPGGYGTRVTITPNRALGGFDVKITRYNSCD